MLANRMPETIGRTRLSPMLSPRGRVIGDFTVTRMDDDTFMMLGAGAMQRFHMRHFDNHLPEDGSVAVENLSSRWAGLMLAGPNARSILGKVADADVGANAFPFLSAQGLGIGNVPDAAVFRVSFTGELGYEIYCPSEYQRTLFDTLMTAGADQGLRLAGGRALMSLRLEKAFPTWGADLGPDYTPFEAGLDRFVKADKADFIGRDAVLAAAEKAPSVQRVQLAVDADGTDASGGEAVFVGGERAGYVSSGGYGHTIGQSLALAYLRPDAIAEGAACTVEVLGEERPAVMHMNALFDPDGSRMRS